MENQEENNNRRSFLKLGLLTGGVIAVGGVGLNKLFAKDEKTGKEATLYSTEGKMYTVDHAHLHECCAVPVSNEEARKGIPGKKFVMVIDLAKCDGCQKCTESCQAMHFLPPEREFIKVFKMKDGESTTPYYMPKPCFHCDNPLCTKVCPVNATFKREDGIVLVDNERCIGCRMCMAACPYSSRFFNWLAPVQTPEMAGAIYSPEWGFPRRKGTVEKCDFCPHMIREGKMPSCASGCPMNAIYFGDQNEDAVTNSAGETVKFTQLIEDNGGYRFMEELGTEPRVYYLAAKNRKYPKPDMNKKEELLKKDFSSGDNSDMGGMDMGNMKM